MLRYMKLLDYKLTYSKQPADSIKSSSYINTDYRKDSDARQLTASYVVMIVGRAVSYCSKYQATVVLSMTKTEYMASIFSTQHAL